MRRRGAANIRSPDIIKRFRHRFIEFNERARLAVETAVGDVSSVSSWLHGEQMRYWRRQHRVRHEKMKEAWRDYFNARYADKKVGKTSCIDERKIYERAKRLKAEAEAKIAKVKAWAAALDREAERLKPPLARFENMVTTLSPRALAQLDHMLDNLEEYLRPSSPKPKSK